MCIRDRCNIAVLGTKSTIESGVYQRLISESLSKVKYYNIRVQGIICTGIEKAVARGENNSQDVALITRYELQNYRGQFDYVVHACTCFPFAEKEINSILSDEEKKIVQINSSKYVAKNVHEILKKIQSFVKTHSKHKKPLLFATGGLEWTNYVEKTRKLVFSRPFPVRQIEIRKQNK